MRVSTCNGSDLMTKNENEFNVNTSPLDKGVDDTQYKEEKNKNEIKNGDGNGSHEEGHSVHI